MRIKRSKFNNAKYPIMAVSMAEWWINGYSTMPILWYKVRYRITKTTVGSIDHEQHNLIQIFFHLTHTWSKCVFQHCVRSYCIMDIFANYVCRKGYCSCDIPLNTVDMGQDSRISNVDAVKIFTALHLITGISQETHASLSCNSFTLCKLRYCSYQNIFMT